MYMYVVLMFIIWMWVKVKKKKSFLSLICNRNWFCYVSYFIHLSAVVYMLYQNWCLLTKTIIIILCKTILLFCNLNFSLPNTFTVRNMEQIVKLFPFHKIKHFTKCIKSGVFISRNSRKVKIIWFNNKITVIK